MEIDNSDKPSESNPENLPRHIHKWGPTFGVGTLVVMCISVLLVAIANYWLVQRANQQIADLLIRLGAAQEHITQMELQQTKTQADLDSITAREAKTNADLDKMDSLVKQLQSADPNRLREILETASNPAINLPLRANAMADHLHFVEANVARIYEAAYWAHDQQYRDNPQVFRNILSETWATDPILRSFLDPSSKDGRTLIASSEADMIDKLVIEKLKQRNAERTKMLEYPKSLMLIVNDWIQRIDSPRPATQPNVPEQGVAKP